MQEEGFRIVSGGTDNHLILVDVRGQKLTGKIAEHLLDEVGVTCNKNTIPFDLKVLLLQVVSGWVLLPSPHAVLNRRICVRSPQSLV